MGAELCLSLITLRTPATVGIGPGTQLIPSIYLLVKYLWRICQVREKGTRPYPSGAPRPFMGPDDVPGQAAWTVRSAGNTGCASAEDGVGMASPCRRRGSERQVEVSSAEEPRRAFQAKGSAAAEARPRNPWELLLAAGLGDGEIAELLFPYPKQGQQSLGAGRGLTWSHLGLLQASILLAQHRHGVLEEHWVQTEVR